MLHVNQNTSLVVPLLDYLSSCLMSSSIHHSCEKNFLFPHIVMDQDIRCLTFTETALNTHPKNFLMG
eukprot:m.95494 g.95494  ORF g.95494 m.95494 type:complete len:67 (-) comp13495_c0_seq1:116-316(-)